MVFSRKKKTGSDNRRGLVFGKNPNSAISEQFRTIRTNIRFSMVDRALKSVVVTSAGPNAGKTLIATNLAASFADEGRKVLLVDTDLRKPTIHKTFQENNTSGLTSLLTNKNLNIDDTVSTINSHDLYIMTSGPIPPNPSEMLGSNRMTEIMKEAGHEFDLVIYDTPPILAVTDAQIMASKVDGTVFVVPKDEVNKDQVTKSAELLKNVKANVLGFVFNKVEKSKDNYYYYYSE